MNLNGNGYGERGRGGDGERRSARLDVRNFVRLSALLRRRPEAWAEICGDAEHSDVRGTVLFYQTPHGVLVAAEIYGLPTSQNGARGRSEAPVFGFHIHEGESCTGRRGDPFANVGSHYNPHGYSHPYHAGDLPPLLGNGGYAFSVFLTDRFAAKEIIGRSVIVHSSPDDFVTQPGGNAGNKIACGEIFGRMAAKQG